MSRPPCENCNCARRVTNSASVVDVLNDLESLGEVSGKCYGYVTDDEGGIILEVYNDDWHGVKQTYQVEVTLTALND